MIPSSRQRKIILAILLMAVGAGGVWFVFFREPQPDINEVGGTILLYEVVRPPADVPNPLVDPAQRRAMIEALERRFGFAGLRHVTARISDNDRLEIAIPNVGKHEEHVEAVKDLVALRGDIEFRVLANSVDDTEAMEEAERVFLDAIADENLRAELQLTQRKGLPPPGPRVPGRTDFKVFSLKRPNGHTSLVRYSWLELGPYEQRTLSLDNAAEHNAERNEAWKKMAERRGRAMTLSVKFGSRREKPLLEGALFFSRTCLDENLTEDQRRQKRFDYFVLSRHPEIDPADPHQRETPRIDGSRLASVGRAQIIEVGSGLAPWNIGFLFDQAGAELFRALTRKNLPSGDDGEIKRHVAIVVDGRVLTTPTINSVIGREAQISGYFTKREAENLAAALASGALPAPLKPWPVAERNVAPKGAR